jgi:peptidyl-prolyl cis-trans isomerase B (cyclophilin B)
MIAELYPEQAPATVANFVKLAQSGFYDGLTFHRVIPGFMIQGGDPDGDGTGGPGWNIPGEFSGNGYTNTLKHTRGTLSMARSSDPDSAGSQFFIMTDDASYLDGNYASFGKLTGGFEALDSIAAAETGRNDKPNSDQVMISVRVENV